MTGYPGNKEKWPITISKFDRVYDLFMGGGGFSRAALRVNPHAKVFGAEANPIQRRILLLSDAERSHILATTRERALVLKMFIDKTWDGQGTYADQYPGKRERLGEAWYHLVKTPFDIATRTGEVDADALVAQVLLSSYGFGANVRISRKGLNVPPNAQKLRGGMPRLSPRVPAQKIESTYQKLRICGGRNTLVLIDPPYCLPRRMYSTHKRLTSCYPGHDPYGEATWDLYWDSITRALDAGVGAAIVAGYYSYEMDYGIRLMASTRGYSVEAISHGALQAQGRRDYRKEHGKRSVDPNLPKPIDYEWRVVRMCDRFEQLGLELGEA
jgi:hypothetical protein